jgi:hypothetical protein
MGPASKEQMRLDTAIRGRNRLTKNGGNEHRLTSDWNAGAYYYRDKKPNPTPYDFAMALSCQRPHWSELGRAGTVREEPACSIRDNDNWGHERWRWPRY